MMTEDTGEIYENFPTSIDDLFEYVPDVVDSKIASLLNQPEEFHEALKNEISDLQLKLNSKLTGQKKNKRNKQLNHKTETSEEDVKAKLLIPLIHLACLFDSSSVLKILFTVEFSGSRVCFLHLQFSKLPPLCTLVENN